MTASSDENEDNVGVENDEGEAEEEEEGEEEEEEEEEEAWSGSRRSSRRSVRRDSAAAAPRRESTRIAAAAAAGEGGRRTSTRRSSSSAAAAVRAAGTEGRPAYGFRDRSTIKPTERLTYPVVRLTTVEGKWGEIDKADEDGGKEGDESNSNKHNNMLSCDVTDLLPPPKDTVLNHGIFHCLAYTVEDGVGHPLVMTIRVPNNHHPRGGI